MKLKKSNCITRERDRIDLSWYVNTNEDVGNFRLELRSGDILIKSNLQIYVGKRRHEYFFTFLTPWLFCQAAMKEDMSQNT